MPQLENFISISSFKHYDLKLNKEKIKLTKSTQVLPLNDHLNIDRYKIKIFKPNFRLFQTMITDFIIESLMYKSLL